MKIIESLIIIITFLSPINTQVDIFFYLSNITKQVRENCRLKGERGVRSFSDCDLESNYTNNQICCMISGINANETDYNGCIAMDANIFGNKTLTYESDKITGTVICDKNYNSGNYFNNIFIFFIYVLLLTFL